MGMAVFRERNVSTAAANTVAILVLVFSVGQGIGTVIAGFPAKHSGDKLLRAGLAALLAPDLTFLLRPPQIIERKG